MQIQSELHLATNPETSEPHATGLVKIPLAHVAELPRVQAIYNALPDDAKDFVQKEGNLAVSHDFTFNEEYKDGVGLVIRDLSLDVSRLKSDEKAQVGAWLREQYGVDAAGDGNIQQAIVALKEHITTDMTAAGMSKDYLIKLVGEQAQGVPHEEREAYIPSAGTAAVMLNSLQSRLRLSDPPNLAPGSDDHRKLENYHAGAVTMRERWPSAQSGNYGRETPEQGEVIFFKGFEAEGSSVVKSGPYAYSCAWPSNVEAFDANGIARDADGKAIPAEKIRADSDYTYVPQSVISAQFTGQQALDRLNGFLDADKAPAYNGYIEANCIGVSGPAVLGKEAFAQIASLPGAGSKGLGLWQEGALQATTQQAAVTRDDAARTQEPRQVEEPPPPRFTDLKGIDKALNQLESALAQAKLPGGNSPQASARATNRSR